MTARRGPDHRSVGRRRAQRRRRDVLVALTVVVVATAVVAGLNPGIDVAIAQAVSDVAWAGFVATLIRIRRRQVRMAAAVSRRRPVGIAAVPADGDSLGGYGEVALREAVGS